MVRPRSREGPLLRVSGSERGRELEDPWNELEVDCNRLSNIGIRLMLPNMELSGASREWS